MNIIIRQASSNDLKYLLEAGKKLNKVERKFEPLSKYSDKKSASRYSLELKKPDSLFLIALDREKRVGYAFAHLDKIDYLDTDKKVCELEVVFIEKEYRKIGVGSALVEKVIFWAREKQALRVSAGIYAKNVQSIALFEKMKFNLYHSSYCLDLE